MSAPDDQHADEPPPRGRSRALHAATHVAALGLLALAAVQSLRDPAGLADAGLLGLLVLTTAAQLFPLPMVAHDDGEASVAIVGIIATATEYGPRAALCVAGLSTLIGCLHARQALRGALFNTSMAAVSAFLGGTAAVAAERSLPGLAGAALGALLAAAVVFGVTMALLAPILARHAQEPVRPVFARVVRAEAPLALLMAPSGLMLDELVDRSPLLLLTVAAPLTALSLYQRSQAQAMAAIRMAQIDHLTSLGNRRAFEAALDRALGGGGRRDRPVGLLLVDVDDFKTVNDAFGHPAGDEVLVRVAACLRDGEAFRLGGDEFAVVLERADVEVAARAAERILARVRDAAAASPAPIAVSVGVATARPGDEKDALVRRADEALYEAKESGKQRAAIAPLRPAA